MKQTILFDGFTTGPIGYTYFEIAKQVTVVATGMGPDDYITFELASVSSPARGTSCDPCDLPPVVMPEATAWQELTCCATCEGYTGPLRLSARNPVVILDAPTGVRIRAVYHGHDFSLADPFTAEVFVQDSEVADVALNLRGCCPPKCECEDLAVSAAPAGETSVTVTISGCPTEVTVRLFDGQTSHEVTGTGTVTVSGLAPNTTYSVEVEGDCCGDTKAVQVKTNAPPPCPTLVLTATSNAPDEVTVTIVSGGPAEVTVGDEPGQYGTGPFTFSGLEPDTSYTVRGTNDCGNKVTTPVATLPCPTVSLTLVSSTTSSVTVALVSGGPALVSLGDATASMVNTEVKTFSGLTAGTEYSISVVSACGNSDFFAFQTAVCPPVNVNITSLGTTDLTVDVSTPEPVELSVHTLDGAALDVAENVTGSHTFSGLPAGEVVYVLAKNECGNTKRVTANLTDPAASPCPSYWLANDAIAFNGYAFTVGDVVDPGATTAYGNLLLFPAPGEGHTVQVTDVNGAVVGYAANKSDCAGCCVLLPKPTPEADLQIEKTATPTTPAVGDTVSWSVTVTNNGPSSADGAIVRDNPPADLVFSAVSVAYSGGATGAASTTVAAMTTGFVIGSFPDGASAVFTYSAVVPVGFEGRALLNNASVEPPEGVSDTNPFNNSDIVVVTVAPSCYLKCEDELVRFSDGASGAGVCLIVTPGGYDPFRARAIMQGRDKTALEGSFTESGNPGTHLHLTITNPYPTPAYLSVDFSVHPQAYFAPGATDTSLAAIGMVAAIKEQLYIPMPDGLSGTDVNLIHKIMRMSGVTSNGSNSVGTNAQEESSGGGRYNRLLAPGETVNLYGQWWLILFQDCPFYTAFVEMNMAVTWSLHRNAVKV